MSEGYPYPQFKLAYPAVTVTVSDLWEVYPELSTGDEAVFAKEVRDAADFSRKREALRLLRDQFDDGAIASALENGAMFSEADDDEVQA